MKTVLFSFDVTSGNLINTRPYLIIVMDKGYSRLCSFVPYTEGNAAGPLLLSSVGCTDAVLDPVLQHEVVNNEYRVTITFTSARSGFRYKVIPL